MPVMTQLHTLSLAKACSITHDISRFGYHNASEDDSLELQLSLNDNRTQNFTIVVNRVLKPKKHVCRGIAVLAQY